MKCETCTFFVSEEDWQYVYGDGECHRHAPVRIRDVSVGSWPQVGKDDFCGEYLSKDTPDDLYILRDGIYDEAPEI